MTHITVDEVALAGTPGSTDATTPRVQVQARSLVNLRHNYEWDSSVAWVSPLGAGGTVSVPAYVRLDSRLGRHFGEFFDLSIVGQNLLQSCHSEFADTDNIVHALIARSIYIRATWRF